MESYNGNAIAEKSAGCVSFFFVQVGDPGSRENSGNSI